MASPWVIASSKALGHFPPKAPLDAKESAGLETGIAAVMYQEGLKMNAWFLLGSAVLGIGAVRLAMYIDQKELRAQQGTKTLSATETQTVVKVERERQAVSPAMGNPPTKVPVGTNGVGHGPPATPEPAPVHKELTAEQAAAIVHFPGEN